jgi:GNAT superfamily N-acetyltransferase
LVAEANGRIVGTVTLAILPSLRRGGRPWAELENVVVSDSHTRRGIGAALVRAAEEIAKAESAYKLHLLSDVETSAAYPFYEAMGFRHSGRGYKKHL